MRILPDLILFGLGSIAFALVVLLWLAPESCPDAVTAILSPATCE